MDMCKHSVMCATCAMCATMAVQGPVGLEHAVLSADLAVVTSVTPAVPQEYLRVSHVLIVDHMRVQLDQMGPPGGSTGCEHTAAWCGIRQGVVMQLFLL
jgi:hypothetical protein